VARLFRDKDLDLQYGAETPNPRWKKPGEQDMKTSEKRFFLRLAHQFH